MRPSLRELTLASALLSALALPAAAQPAPASGDRAACTTEVATLERNVEAARAKGQMLRRQQLADQLDALRARCQHDGAPATGHTARVEALERDIAALRTQLDNAEEALRKLKSEAP